MHQLGSIYLEEDCIEEAVNFFKDYVSLQKHIQGTNSFEVAKVLSDVGSDFLKKHQCDFAVYFFDECVCIHTIGMVQVNKIVLSHCIGLGRLS